MTIASILSLIIINVLQNITLLEQTQSLIMPPELPIVNSMYNDSRIDYGLITLYHDKQLMLVNNEIKLDTLYVIIAFSGPFLLIMSAIGLLYFHSFTNPN